MSLLFIDENKILGSGNERICFIHPTDETKCLKINQPDIIHRNQNKIERYYLNKLKSRSVPFTHLAEYYGEVNTDRGKGLMFERILNPDKSPSIRFDQAITQGIINKTQAKELLNELKIYLLKYAIYIGDCNRDQLLLQQTLSGYRIKVIDGLGTRNFGIKLKLVSHFTWYARFKLKAKWPFILRNYNFE
jgi:hypothetical protein